MAPFYVGEKKYESEIIIRSFEYFAMPRAFYIRLRDDYQLPSVTTLTRLTSKTNKIDDTAMMKNVLSNVAKRQKSFILLIDEVYVKPSLLYHGGTVLGKAVNKPSALANTVLGFLRMIPVTELDSIFLFDTCQKVINIINEAGGNVISIISDDNRVNQKKFKTFDCVLNKPWLTKNGIYLLFDFVHLLKSIRNNWITEKTKELVFPENGEMGRYSYPLQSRRKQHS